MVDCRPVFIRIWSAIKPIPLEPVQDNNKKQGRSGSNGGSRFQISTQLSLAKPTKNNSAPTMYNHTTPTTKTATSNDNHSQKLCMDSSVMMSVRITVPCAGSCARFIYAIRRIRSIPTFSLSNNNLILVH